jgi:hypothetical protein
MKALVSRQEFDAAWETLWGEFRGHPHLSTAVALVELLNRRLFGQRPKPLDIVGPKQLMAGGPDPSPVNQHIEPPDVK